jgi:hypothetical protein
MTAQNVYNQIQGNQTELNPYLANAGLAPQYFQDEVNKRFDYNRPAIQNAAALEARAYSLPGELMENYRNEYEGAGVGSMNKMNSILKNIGNQFATSNVGWNIVDQAKLRQQDMIKNMVDQYGQERGALQDRHNMLLPLWQQMYGDEQAMARLRASIRGSGNNNPVPVDPSIFDTGYDDESNTPGQVGTPPRPLTITQKIDNSARNLGGVIGMVSPKAGNWLQDQYMNRVQPTLKRFDPIMQKLKL